jgi:F-type H+-transporting ATPase subunit b
MLDFSVTFIITILNITILFFVLRKLLFKPVTKFMADRAKRVQDSLDQAEKDRTQAKAMLREYEGKLKSAEAEAGEIIKTARDNADKEAKRIIESTKAESAEILSAARKQIEADRRTAVTKLRFETAALVMAASSKLAAREFSRDDNRRYVEMLLDELAAQKGNI